MYLTGTFRLGDVVRPRKTGEIVVGEFYRARTVSQYAGPISQEKVGGKEFYLPFGYYEIAEMKRDPHNFLGFVFRFKNIQGAYRSRDFDLIHPVYRPGDKVETADYWGNGPYVIEEVIEKGHRQYLRLKEFSSDEPRETIFYRRVYAV